MLVKRIAGAFLFRKEVYGEVEKDKSFTATAWLLVVVVSFLSKFGSLAHLGFGSFGRWLLGAIVSTVFAVVGFTVGAWAVSWVGKALFKADVTFEEMVRTLGLAYVWNAVGVLGVVSAIAVPLACLLAPVTIISAVLGLIAWLIAAKEALDLDWLQTGITLVVGWIVSLVIGWAAGLVLGLFGISAGVLRLRR